MTLYHHLLHHHHLLLPSSWWCWVREQSYLDEVLSSVTNLQQGGAVVFKICYQKKKEECICGFSSSTNCTDRIENINTCRLHTDKHIYNGKMLNLWDFIMTSHQLCGFTSFSFGINPVVHGRIPTLTPSLSQNICGHKLSVGVLIQAGSRGWIRNGYSWSQASEITLTLDVSVYYRYRWFQRKLSVLNPNIKLSKYYIIFSTIYY